MRSGALIACLLSLAPAGLSAAEWRAGVGGYMIIGAGFGDTVRGDGVGVFRDGEIHFKANMTADNGLTFRTHVELEATTDGDQIDENWASVSGSFGTVMVGGNDSALSNQGGVGILYPTGAYLNYYDDQTSQLPGDPFGRVGSDDSIGIHYSYSTGGLTFGASYQPDDDTGATNDIGGRMALADDNRVAVAANYSGGVGGFDYVVGGGYLISEDLESYNLGVEIYLDGFAIAGFANSTNLDGATLLDADQYGIGALHDFGPWTIGGGYVLTDFQHQSGDWHFAHFGGGYDLAPGVTSYAAFQYGEDNIGNNGYLGAAWLSLRF